MINLDNFIELQKRREELERLEKEKQTEIRSYNRLMVQEKMTSNKDIAAKGKSLAELEEDFMWLLFLLILVIYGFMVRRVLS